MVNLCSQGHFSFFYFSCLQVYIILLNKQHLFWICSKKVQFVNQLMDPSKVLTLKGLQLDYEQTKQRLNYLLEQSQEDTFNSKDEEQLKQLSSLLKQHLNQPIKEVVGIERRAGISFYFINFFKKREAQTAKPQGPKEQVGPALDQEFGETVELTPFPTTKILDSKTILRACAEIQIKELVDSVQFEIKVEELSQLKDLGKMVVIAYACTDGYSCSKQMALLTTSFSKLLSDSGSTCFKFVKACTYSLKFHRNAIGYGREKRYSLCLQEIGRISEVAEEMIEWSKDMLSRSQQLRDINQEASNQVTFEYTGKKEQNQKITQKLSNDNSDLDVMKLKLTDNIKKYTSLMASFKAESEQAEKRLQQNMKNIQAQKQCIMDLTNVKNNQSKFVNQTKTVLTYEYTQFLWWSWIEVKPYTYTVRSKNQKWEEQQKRIGRIERQNDQKYEQIQKLMDQRKNILNQLLKLREKMRVGKEAIQQEEMELHKNLLEKFGEIVKASFNQNRLEIAIKSLDTCKQLLLKIIKSFQSFLKFWTDVKQQCSTIKKDLQKDGHFKVEKVFRYKHSQFLNAISDSNIQWMALGKQTIGGYEAMKLANDEMSKIINRLPNAQNLPKFIETEYNALNKQITGNSVYSSKIKQGLKVEDPRQLFKTLGGSLS